MCISILSHVKLVSRIQNDETHPVTILTFKKVENLCCQFIFHKMRPKCNLIKRKVLISHISQIYLWKNSILFTYCCSYSYYLDCKKNQWELLLERTTNFNKLAVLNKRTYEYDERKEELEKGKMIWKDVV